MSMEGEGEWGRVKKEMVEDLVTVLDLGMM